MAALGNPAEFRQLPKYVDGRVDSRSCHVPRARTKENMECFLDDTVFIQSHAFLWEGSEEGSRLSAGLGLCFGKISPVCRRGSLGCAHSQGRLLDALPGGRAMGTQLCSCPHRQSADTGPVHTADALLLLFPALGTQLVPISAPHGHGMAWPTGVLSPEQAALAHTTVTPVPVSCPDTS